MNLIIKESKSAGTDYTEYNTFRHANILTAFPEVSETWKTGTLNDFLQKQAEGEYDVPTATAAFDNYKATDDEIQHIINFLRKLSDNLNIANAISQTRTFKVSKWLKRNDDTIETKLTLMDKEDKHNVFTKIIKLITQVFGALGVLLLIISGVMMVMSRGEETMLQKAKQTFIYTLIGLVIGFLSYTIVRFILELLLMR